MPWNSLEIPLECSWQCTLHAASQYHSMERERRSSLFWDRDSSRSRGWSSFMRDDRRDEEDARRQLEQDRRDFDRYFRPRLDLRTITGGQALREIQIYVRDALGLAHWNLPTDNASIERVLRQAVNDGRLVPVVHRDRRSALGRVYSPTPAPLRWPSSGGGGGTYWSRSPNLFPPGITSFNGEPVLSGPYDPATWESRLVAARAAMGGSSSGGALLGVVEAVAGALVGGNADMGEGDGVAEGFAESAEGTSTPFSGAHPFEYGDDAVSGDSFDLAGNLTPNKGAAGSWYTNPGSGQMRMYGQDGFPVVDFDFDHDHGQGIPHAHNWEDAGGPFPIRGPGVRFSPLP
ncbi:hypothetical protein HDG34_001868 [Paraburkholderia sp. HC6.4b]|uniref:hypothetical protein n=1 Tax=unclassified Paraburkholderia TaxID=2615204 RepID=UPI001612AA75|nr:MULTISPECIES: hypothetical protein [unclassified Paraburkholderia]MBB5407936.1 hypothetical protein [Paraburkholderia sp. HC6.4b]MBB5453528.1 hypothetical protein [Paraburkholderia sp. Kb1A]